MSNPFKIPLEKLQATMESIKPQLIDAMGVEALKFIDDNFAAGGYHGTTFRRWPDRKSNKDSGRGILIGPGSGHLRKSFRARDEGDHVVIGTDIVYARVHNEGFRGPVYVRSRMGTFGTPFTRNMNIPQRQFMPINDRPPMLLAACRNIVVKKITDALPK